jgi:hypothetical protein
MSGSARGELTHEDLDKGLIEAKSAAAFSERAYDEFMTFRGAKDLLTITASGPDLVEDWLDRIHQMERLSKARGNYIPQPDGKPRPLQFWDFGDAREDFVDHMRVEFNARINSISDLGRMAVFNLDRHLYIPFYDFNPQSLIFAFRKRKEGLLATVSGSMGLGKTDFTCLIIEELLACPTPEFNIITNIKFDQETMDAHEGRLLFRRDMRGLLRALCETVLGDSIRHSVVPLDETSMFFSRREPGKKDNILQEKFIRLIRKYNASLLYIDQLKDGLPGAALELRTIVYHKTDLRKVHYSSYTGGRKYNHYLRDVPQTTLGFITKDIGSFSMNVPLEKLFAFIEKKEDAGINAVRATLMYLDWLEENQPTMDPYDERVLKAIGEHPGTTQTGVLNLLGEEGQAARMRLSRAIGRQLSDFIEVEKDGAARRYYLRESVNNTKSEPGNTTTE